jgi:PAS domain S-box-containing protein
MVVVKDAETLRFLRLNTAGEKLLGYSREELLGKNDFDFFPPEEARFFNAKDKEVLAQNSILDIPQETIQTKHQGIRILHTKKIR